MILRKKCFLTMLLLLIWLPSPSTQAQKTVHTHQTVKAIIHANQWLLDNNQQVIIPDIVLPDLENPQNNEACFVPQLKRFLNDKISGQKVRIKHSSASPNPRRRPRFLSGPTYLKTSKTKLPDLFIELGWADYTGSEKKFLKLEAEAKKYKRGRWGSCHPFREINNLQHQNGDTWFIKNKTNFLHPTSTTWVKKVLSPTDIQLHNDLIIKIEGLTPIQTANVQLNQCLGDQAIGSLNKLIKGRQIWLEKDQTQALNSRTLSRHVWLNGQLVGQNLIETGTVFYQTPALGNKYQAKLEATQKQAFLQLPKTWQTCLDQALQPKTPTPPETPIDPKCPIKGNISGSKKNPKRTYHTPESGWYKRIKAERCFASEKEAEEAGFKKVR